jgi:hypothetical protein
MVSGSTEAWTSRSLRSFQTHKEHIMTYWTKNLSAVTLIAAALALFAGGAQAQGAYSPSDLQQKRLDNRQARQSDRITQGVASGELTVREQARLEKQQRHINRLERRTESDGHVTAREALRVERAQDRASRDIRRQKHDRQHKG